MGSIYVDHAATSPLHPEALEAMLPYFNEHFGNPSSTHSYGRKARQALNQARTELARSIGAHPNEIIFTSGGTEADNLAIFGYIDKNKQRGKHVITTSIEHHAVLHAFSRLEEEGFDVTYLEVDESGLVSVEEVKKHVQEDTILASIMLGNNEVGTIQPIQELGAFFREKGIAFHTDAVQAYGILPIDVKQLNVDFLSVSSHKVNGPKGVGFLYARQGVLLTPTSYGGEQERKRRAGTENVASIVGFAKAASLAVTDQEDRSALYRSFKSQMIRIFEENELNYMINGSSNYTLPHILNVSFTGVNIEQMLVNLDMAGICASSGSACTAGTHKPSHVLKAMKCDEGRLMSAVRFSFGRGNSIEDIEKVANETIKIVKRLQKA